MIPCAAGKAALRPSAWVTETWHSVRTAAKDSTRRRVSAL